MPITTGQDYWRRMADEAGAEAASVDNFMHTALAYDYGHIVCPGTVVAVAHRTTGQRRSTVAYWLAGVVRVFGYFVRLRWLGAGCDSTRDFWRNSAYSRKPSRNEVDKRIHPIEFVNKNNFPFQPPEFLNNVRDWKGYLRRELASKSTLPRDFHEIIKDESQCSLRPLHMVEATSVRKISAMRPAVVVRDIGRRIQLRFVDGAGNEQFAWYHEFSEHLQPCGWSQLIGREVVASPKYIEYARNKLIRFDEPPTDEELSIFNFKPTLVLTTVFEALKRRPFKKGDEILVLDFLSPGIRVGRILRVLKNSYLIVQIVPDTGEDDLDPICVHAASERVLSPKFAEIWHLEELLRPRNYRFRDPESLPSELFERHVPPHDYSSNQFLEYAGICGSSKIYAVRVVQVCGHLLHVRFEGYPESEDQLVPITSPDIYGVGWCHANGHPLIHP